MNGSAEMAPPLAVVVSYCKNERPFIDALLQNAAAFADLVVLSVGRRLYTGEPEDETGLQEVVRDYMQRPTPYNGGVAPPLRVARYDVPDDQLDAPVRLHNAARAAGVQAARDLLQGTDFAANFWALLLDGDEVPDGEAVADWWAANGRALEPSAAYKIANRWYFLHPCLVAEPAEDSIVLVHDAVLRASSDALLKHPRERDGLCASAPGGTARMVRGLTGEPMFHHYSWVRADRHGLLRKVANWGHSGDQPWGAMINEALDGLEQGRWPTRDFVHGYPLRRLDAPAHDLPLLDP